MSLDALSLDADGSFAWLGFPGEAIERASCALAVAGGVLVVDPVDAAGLDEALATVGPVIGVATLFQRHRRDADALAARHRAPRLWPRALGGPGLAVAGVEEVTVAARAGWHEAALWLPERRLLVCMEALGTSGFFLARQSDRLGVHPLGRLLPGLERAFAGLEPETVAVGHGRPLVGGAAPELRRALARARRDLPRAWARALSAFVPGRAAR